FMGSEFAQNDEWSASDGLQWYLTEFDEHKGVQKVVSAINRWHGEADWLAALPWAALSGPPL
ncbi:MAG: hypothetical protein EBU14_09090, partial [Acetobacteraceae bacterium]|nr:hypothetical protein [Acetobacteraceae bacterium]